MSRANIRVAYQYMCGASIYVWRVDICVPCQHTYHSMARPTSYVPLHINLDYRYTGCVGTEQQKTLSIIIACAKQKKKGTHFARWSEATVSKKTRTTRKNKRRRKNKMHPLGKVEGGNSLLDVFGGRRDHDEHEHLAVACQRVLFFFFGVAHRM